MIAPHMPPTDETNQLVFHPDYATKHKYAKDHIIIRTEDGVHFYHSVSQLAMHSGFFEDLFELSSIATPSEDNKVDIIPLDKISSRGLDTILKAIFLPWKIDFLPNDGIDRIHQALIGALAYDFHTFQDAIRLQLESPRLTDKISHLALAAAFGLGSGTDGLINEILRSNISILDDSNPAAFRLLEWCGTDDLTKLRRLYQQCRQEEMLSEVYQDFRKTWCMLDGNNDFRKRCKGRATKLGCKAYVKYHGSFSDMRHAAADQFISVFMAQQGLFFEDDVSSAVIDSIRYSVPCDLCRKRLAEVFVSGLGDIAMIIFD